MISSRVAEGQFLSNTVRFGHETNVPRTTIKSDKLFKGVQSLVVQMPIYMSNSGESRMKQNITIQARLHQGELSITLLSQFCQLCHSDLYCRATLYHPPTARYLERFGRHSFTRCRSSETCCLTSIPTSRFKL